MPKPHLFTILDQPPSAGENNGTLVLELSHIPGATEAQKIVHDLRGSANAVRFHLESQLKSLTSPSERDLKKAEQLTAHHANLEWAVQEICRLLVAKSK